MEAEEVGSESAAATSSAIAETTVAGTEDSVMTRESSFDMPTEITPAETDQQPSRSSVQYSMDLRKELSLDVLASLGDLTADDAKHMDESMLDLGSVREDMDFISELSSLGPPVDHDDSASPETFELSCTIPLVEPRHGLDSSGLVTTSNVCLPRSLSPSRLSESSTSFGLEGLPGYDRSLVLSAEKSFSSHRGDEVAAGTQFTSTLPLVRSSTISAGGALLDNGDALSSVPSVTPWIEDNPQIADASTELLSSGAREELTESAIAGPPVSESNLVSSSQSHSRVEPVSPVSPSSVRDSAENPAVVDAGDDSPRPSLSSPDFALVSDISPVVPVRASLPLDSLPLDAIERFNSALAGNAPPLEPLEQASLTSSNPAAFLSPAPPASPISDVQSPTVRDIDTMVAPSASHEFYPLPSETILSADLPTSTSPVAPENPSLESPRLQFSAAASGDEALVASWASPSPPATANVSMPKFSRPLNFVPVEHDLSAPFNDSDVLVASALDTTVPDITRAVFTPSLFPTKLSPISDSTASPPLTARYWDASAESPGISLSVYFDGSRASFRGRKILRKRRFSEGAADYKDMKGKGLCDVEKLEEVAEVESMLEAQKRMVKWQIDEIQRIATLQFQLTGSNPLSEQAMWEVLGVRGGGNKARDALSPEALKSLQEIFALKDTLTKKEARDISFTFGASLTQVKDYFAAQRSLVRKLVQQAQDEVGRLGIKNASEQSQQISVSNFTHEAEMDLGFDKLSGPESIDKIIDFMRAERGFAGQVQLLQVILRTDPATLILRRFLEKGALKILGGWLVEAVTEQQTSVISHLLKVLDHLPMSNAVSNQMPPLVHNVNKLRFHQASAVAGQARLLLTKWVKLLSPKTEGKSASLPGSKSLSGSVTPPGGLKRSRDSPAAQVVPETRKKKVRAEDVLQQDSKPSQIAGPDSPSLSGMPQVALGHPSSGQPSVSVPPPAKPKWSSTLQPSESAVAAVSVSRKRLGSSFLGDQSKDRRKMMRVDDNHIGKSMGSKPASISKTSRPLSTDDIYKAKKLERLMQEPILKSKRKMAAVQEQSRAQDGLPQTSSRTKPLPPAPADNSALRRDALSSSQGGWRGGGLTANPSHEDQPTATRTQLPITSSEHHDIVKNVTPTSSKDIFQTITPTSSQEQAHPGSVLGGLTEDTACKRDSNVAAVTEVDRFPSSVSSSPFGGSLQLPAAVIGSQAVNSVASDAAASDSRHSTLASQPFVADTKNLTAPSIEFKPVVEKNVHVSPATIERSEVRLEESAGPSGLRGIQKSLNRSAMDVTRSEVVAGKGQDRESGGNHVKPISRETSLSDYYAVLRSTMVRWRIPPEYEPNEQWNVAAGEDSKEREVQSGRVKREEEAYYPELSTVPNDPKDPWEEEPDYDDSLTFQIFVEGEQRKVLLVNDLSTNPKTVGTNGVQYGLGTSFGSDGSSISGINSAVNANQGQNAAVESLSTAPAMNGLDQVLQQLSAGGVGGTHDPDLLALLLRNPQLVSQLTSGSAFTPTSISNPGVFMQPVDLLKQPSRGGNNGAGLSTPTGDLGQERQIPSNNSKALGIPLQPGRSVSSVDQTPPETVRGQDSIPMMPHPGMGQQQTMGFAPQGGVDNRFLTAQMPSSVARNIQDTSGWEHLRVPPPPPPLPPTQPVINQVLQPPLANQPNKQSNWHEPPGWVGIGRPPLNPPQTRSGPDQLHTRQTLMTHNVRLPNYSGMVGVPKVEVGPETSALAHPETHHSQRPWINGSHSGPIRESSVMHVGEDSGLGRNNRWQRQPVRPPNQQVRPLGNRELTDFNNGRQTSVVDNRSVWVLNERARPVLQPFQAAYTLPPPPPYPAPLWQGQEGNMRLVQGSAVNPFSHGRDLRPTQQQLWHNNMGPASRQPWRGQQ